jgi:hypothetical protein
MSAYSYSGGTWAGNVSEIKARQDAEKAKAAEAEKTKMAANVRPETVHAAGFGEALSSLTAGGGGLKFRGHNRPATYRSGAIRGMTEDQALEHGKKLWDGASPAIREKYANRAATRPTASEMGRAEEAERKKQWQPTTKPKMAAFDQPENQAPQMAAFQPRQQMMKLPGTEESEVQDSGSDEAVRGVNAPVAAPVERVKGRTALRERADRPLAVV